MDLLGWFPLTQYGQMTPLAGDAFKDRLNTEAGEEELSLILGAVDAVAASALVRKYVIRDAIRRLTTAGELRQRKFRVKHTPTRQNYLHVSVWPPDGKEWDAGVAADFSACFTGYSQGVREVTESAGPA